MSAATVGGPPGHSNFSQFYNDHSKDEFGGQYATLMANFSPGNGQTPAQLRDAASRDPRDNTVGFLVLQEFPGDPLHPGQWVAYHNVGSYRRRMGAMTTQWDDRTFMSTGDLVGGSLANTYELPDNTFSMVQHGNAFLMADYDQRQPCSSDAGAV